MSFSAQVRAELAALRPEKACCMDAELAALGLCRLGLQVRDAGDACAVFRSEHPGVIKRAYVLLKARHGIAALPRRSARAVRAGRHLYSLWLSAEDTQRLYGGQGKAAGADALRLPLRLPRRECCRRAALRGMLLACGSVEDPRKGFKAELTLPDRAKALYLGRLLGLCGVEAGLRARRGRWVVTVGGAERLVRLLTLAGAVRSVLETENLRVRSGLNARLNRAMNCEQGNLLRQVEAAARQTAAVEAISLALGLSFLPEALHQLARLRLANREASLAQLGAMLSPPLAKTAVQQRMRRILAIAENLGAPGEKTPKGG